MLNLTFMFTGTPAPITGGRIVRGSSMSAEHNGVVKCNKPRKLKQAAPVKKPSAASRAAASKAVMAKSDAKYEAVMKGLDWMTTTTIAMNLGMDSRAGISVLRRLLAAGKIEKRWRKPRHGGKPYCEWRWL